MKLNAASSVKVDMYTDEITTDFGWQYWQTGKATGDKQAMTPAQAAFGVSTPGSIGPAPMTGGKPPTAPRASAPGARRLSFDHMAGLHLFPFFHLCSLAFSIPLICFMVDNGTTANCSVRKQIVYSD